MPKKTGIWRTEWARCSRCWFLYPIGQLTPQKGLMVCPKDLDRIDVEIRARVIGEALSTDEEGVSQKNEMMSQTTAGDIEL